MICMSCRTAGDLNKAANDTNEEDTITVPHCTVDPRCISVVKPPTQKVLYIVAEIFHDQCKGSTHCDCQHKTGSGLINNG